MSMLSSSGAGPSGRAPMSGFSGEDRHNFFLALRPPAEKLQRVSQWARMECRRRRFTSGARPSDVFHVTLFPLGRFGEHEEVADRILDIATDAISGFSHSPFDLTFDRVMSFGGSHASRAQVLTGGTGVGQLMVFHQALGRVLAGAGLSMFTRAKFTPHLTFAYDPRVIVPHAITPIAWTVREFFLIHSVIGETRHMVVRRWNLAGNR